jgi:hypothetical protein
MNNHDTPIKDLPQQKTEKPGPEAKQDEVTNLTKPTETVSQKTTANPPPGHETEDNPGSLEKTEAATETAVVPTTPPPVLLDEVYARTIAMQLAGTIPNSDPSSADFKICLEEAVAAYKLMNPADPAESAICRLMIGITSAGMESLTRATGGAQRHLTQETDLKLAMKAALTVTELIKTLDARRGRYQQTVNVGQVNVQSGGRAIVGNVGQPKDGEKGGEAAPASSKPSDDDEEAA